MVKEAFYLIEFVNPRNDQEIEMKPSLNHNLIYIINGVLTYTMFMVQEGGGETAPMRAKC